MQTHRGCKYANISRDYSVEDLAAFHGHLGPYIVLGYRIGRYIRSTFCGDPFRLTAIVHCSGSPPDSCIVDGVQIGSGCTLGKGNIRVVAGDRLCCEFSADGRRILVTPRPFAAPERGDDYDLMIEELAEQLYTMPDGTLFDAEEV